MAPLTILSVLAAALSCAATSLTAPALALRPSARNPAAASSCQVVLRRLRGGAEGEDEDEDELMELDAELDGGEDDDEADAEAESNLAHANPFLPGGAAAGLGLGDLTKSLSDPAMLQQALKELQDPATQERFKQMMEDPAFLESMKAYAEQITKDPMFDQLKAQAEKMMSDPAFMEEMQKAMSDPNLSAALAGMASGTNGAPGDDEDDN